MCMAADIDTVETIARDTFAECNATVNEWSPGSAVSALNAASEGTDVPLPAPLATCLATSATAHRISGGRFDAAVGALTSLWRESLSEEPPRVPDPAEVCRNGKEGGRRHTTMQVARRSTADTSPDATGAPPSLNGQVSAAQQCSGWKKLCVTTEAERGIESWQRGHACQPCLLLPAAV